MIHRKGRRTTGDGRVREACRIAYRVQLYIQFFNQINCWFLHALKLICISAAILHGYVGIRFGHQEPLIGVFCAAVHVVVYVIYCGIIQNAYHPADLQKQAKRELLAASGTNARARKELLKVVTALRCRGVEVGTFHEIERNSALTFIDFVEKQLMSLLVAF